MMRSLGEINPTFIQDSFESDGSKGAACPFIKIGNSPGKMELLVEAGLDPLKPMADGQLMLHSLVRSLTHSDRELDVIEVMIGFGGWSLSIQTRADPVITCLEHMWGLEDLYHKKVMHGRIISSIRQSESGMHTYCFMRARTCMAHCRHLTITKRRNDSRMLMQCENN
jgi:hypothetical protein